MAAKKSTSKAKSKTKAKRATKKSSSTTPVVPVRDEFSIRMQAAYDKRLRASEKRYNLASSSISVRARMSTGLLVPDLIMGGGIVPGMYSIAGPEQSAKSTLTYHVLRSALDNNIPVIQSWDAEGSYDPTYTGNILGSNYDIKAIFEGKPPRARYYSENVLEDFFNIQAEVLRFMPDKVYVEDAGTWCYLFPKRDKAAASLMSDLQIKPDKALTTDSHFYCPTDRSGPEGITFVDSWPSLVTSDVDDDEASNALALDARAFSKHLKRIAGKFRRKGFILFGVNQIRENPGVRYGPTEYEPGGNALKFYSSVRNQIRARAVPPGWERSKDNSGVCIEDSAELDGAQDEYQFKHFKNTKNKFSAPFGQGWMRVWTKDSKGEGRGFDPFFDTLEYLRLTNQISGNKKGYSINIGSLKDASIDLYTLKCLVLGELNGDRETMQYVKEQTGLNKLPKLQQECFKQISSGKAFELLNAVSNVEEEYDEDEDLEDLKED